MDQITKANARYRRASSFQNMTHPLYAGPLVNRNPTQTNRNYAPGYDAQIPGMVHPD